MDSDKGKLFVGGLSWETNEEKLSDYFKHFGEVVETLVVRDTFTGRPRGFGFVVFSDPSILDRIIGDKHTLDGRTVEVKRAISREEQQKAGFRTGGRSSDNGVNIRTKKIFVGGLPPTLTEDGFHQYFESYGHVMDVVIMIDQSTQRPRGFGFVTYDTEDAVERVLHKSFHDLNGKTVEVKRALPRDSYSGSGGQSGGGGGYQGHHSLSSGNGMYDNGQDGNMYMQPHAVGAGFVDYGAGYGVQGYGYGPINNAVAYGGFGVVNYSTMGPGYSALYGGYGNQNTAYSDDQYYAGAFVATGQSQNGAATYGYYGGQDGSLASKSSHDSGKGYANCNRDSDFSNTARCSNPSQDGNYGTDKTSESGGGKAGAYGVHHPNEARQQ